MRSAGGQGGDVPPRGPPAAISLRGSRHGHGGEVLMSAAHMLSHVNTKPAKSKSVLVLYPKHRCSLYPVVAAVLLNSNLLFLLEYVLLFTFTLRKEKNKTPTRYKKRCKSSSSSSELHPLENGSREPTL